MLRASITREDETLFEPRSAAARGVGAEDDSPRVLDLDPEEESPFLRAQRRVPVRRGPLAKKTANRLRIILVVLAVAGTLAVCASVLYGYAEHSWRFRIRSGNNIEIAGTQTVARRQVMEVFAADVGRNILWVPLEERRRQLEAIPWVESATVIRLLPDRLRVDLTERTPVAFVRLGSRIALIDRDGVVMELPRSRKYSFPVIKGISEAEPLSKRAAHIQMYSRLMRELDSEGAHYSADLSEVDLSDSEDVKVVVVDPAGAVLVHLGNFDFLRRYKIYLAHLQEWRQQFQKVDSVDLRYEHQIIVNPDSGVHPTNPHPAPAAPHKAAGRFGVAKPTGSIEATVHAHAAAGKPAATAQLAKPAATTQPAIPKPAPAEAKKPSPVHKPSMQTATDSRTGTQ